MANKNAKQPNILIIWGDDIGWMNPSCYHQGVMGYRTPNIDRLAAGGARFTDWYGQQSCTAGRAAFITGQSPIRTGLTKVGLPGAKIGLQAEDPTIADLLKPLGYATGQFGKNHIGDRDEFLPTVHGFDEFFGNLYHLNAEEEPENPDYPKNPAFKKAFGPRGVLRCKANPDGTQTIEDTGPLTRKRMETVDDEFVDAALDFMDRKTTDGTPFFLWFNSTRMHIFTHLKQESQGVTGLGVYPDGMVEHDLCVGRLLDKLDELGITDNTIVMYSTDNGAEVMSWPDGGSTPFRGEKDTNFEGGWRVPCLLRWPGVIEPGTISNEIFSHTDMLPTLLGAAGEPDIVDKLKKGHKVGKKTPDGTPMANTWQGTFPHQNLVEDGFDGTAPVGSFPPNGYGLHDMAGNVWEWTTDFYQEHRHIQKPCCGQVNPRGGTKERSFDPRQPGLTIPRRVMKGGSYLCAPNYCRRYRPAARMAQPIDTSTCHLGFRCIVRER